MLLRRTCDPRRPHAAMWQIFHVMAVVTLLAVQLILPSCLQPTGRCDPRRPDTALLNSVCEGVGLVVILAGLDGPALSSTSATVASMSSALRSSPTPAEPVLSGTNRCSTS